MDGSSTQPPESDLVERPVATRRRVGWRIHALRTALIVGCVGGGILGFRFYDKTFVPKNLGVVEPGVIYRSGQIQDQLIAGVLRDHGIRAVVNLQGPEHDNPDQVAESQVIAALGLEGFRFPMRGDGVGTVETYARAVEQLALASRTGRPTLIHCAAGSQRTGGTVACYRLLVRGDDPADVFAEALRYDWEPRKDTEWPAWLNANMAAIAARLVELGVIEAVPEVLPRFGNR